MTRTDSTDQSRGTLDQYTFYANTASDVSNRRLKTNRFYVSLLSGILVAFPFVLDLDNLTTIRLIAMFTIGFIGVVISILWFFNIWSYKQLNSGKYEIIHDLEKDLPYPCFTREWEVLAEGRDPETYLTHWKVERLVPWMIGIPYLGLMVFASLHFV